MQIDFCRLKVVERFNRPMPNVPGFVRAGNCGSARLSVKPFGLMMFEDIQKYDALLPARN
jgi:hypothetical protein